ncbi:SCP2 sterol-binding domain-containing protein [Jannaschia ovalis]|uniref:SCP2 sterol-binding domain-containing protein n=1 Tax=Jannaschia ovalis TaxID=3038773 RepID=A0ABY8LEI8_9RHOB|nr:SCP2 sterol-binding domain-containing protein [Jannaschia sp. GRR-S6-38]WGH79052.1 SCP2 sterol-binding domain-containing protein [Jannaschia sp. GRR-S6-38]
MSDIINEAVTQLSAKIGTFDGSVKFVIPGEGSIMVDEAGVREGDEDAACTMTAEADTFKGILDGDVNATSAFMSGQLKVDGDMGQAMKLGAQL